MIDIERIGVPAFAMSVSPDGTFQYLGINAVNTAQTGLRTEDVTGRRPEEIFDAEIADRLLTHYRRCVAEGRMIDYEVSAEFPAGRSSWRASLIPMVGATGRVEGIVGVCHDLQVERRLERDLQDTNRHLDLAIRCLKGAEWRFDARSGRFSASDNLALLMGEETPRPVPWAEWVARILPEDLSGAACDILLSGAQQEQVVRFRFRGSRGDMRWAQCRRLVTGLDEAAPVVCGVLVDVTDECRREAKLEAEAHRDSLTGLLNRRGLKRTLRHAIGERNEPLALLMVDLDGFKQVNDRLGHAAGDAVLVEVARRLTALLGQRAMIARLGGDEFTVAATGLSRAEAIELHRQIGDALGRPHRLDHGPVIAGASVGLCWRPEASDMNEMMAEADGELYLAKRNRKRAPAIALDAGLFRDQMSLFAA